MPRKLRVTCRADGSVRYHGGGARCILPLRLLQPEARTRRPRSGRTHSTRQRRLVLLRRGLSQGEIAKEGRRRDAGRRVYELLAIWDSKTRERTKRNGQG